MDAATIATQPRTPAKCTRCGLSFATQWDYDQHARILGCVAPDVKLIALAGSWAWILAFTGLGTYFGGTTCGLIIALSYAMLGLRY
jgi:hypothetical protein